MQEVEERRGGGEKEEEDDEAKKIYREILEVNKQAVSV